MGEDNQKRNREKQEWLLSDTLYGTCPSSSEVFKFNSNERTPQPQHKFIASHRAPRGTKSVLSPPGSSFRKSSYPPTPGGGGGGGD